MELFELLKGKQMAHEFKCIFEYIELSGMFRSTQLCLNGDSSATARTANGKPS